MTWHIFTKYLYMPAIQDVSYYNKFSLVSRVLRTIQIHRHYITGSFNNLTFAKAMNK